MSKKTGSLQISAKTRIPHVNKGFQRIFKNEVSKSRKNAGILAAQIIGAFDQETGNKIETYKKQMENEVKMKIEKLRVSGQPNGFD